MGSRYLTDLANVVRGAGITVQEEPGWQTRARGSGGYNSGLPNHVMAHHTASNASSDGQADVNYMCYGSENRPISNLYLSRSGKVWVMAAGATNTNGSGHDPCGATANDSMNSSAIGIECANNGVGEPYPTVQQDVYVKLCRVLCDHYGIPNGRIHSHFEWAPDRKIDPAGQSRYASGGNKWNMGQFRSDCAAGAGGGGGGTGSTYQGDDVAVAIQSSNGNDVQKAAVFAWQPGVAIGHLVDQTSQDVGRITGTLAFDGAGKPLRNFTVAQIADMISRYWSGGPKPAGW